AIPVGLLVCRLYGVDIRTVGSGRTGGTNAWRAAGLKAAIPTVVGDAIKGAVAVWIVRGLGGLLFPEPVVMSVPEATSRLIALQLAVALAGGAAIIGHNWSVFIGFKGGAGGITSAATTMAISPLVGGMVWLIGILIIWWGRMASVATFTVGASAFALFLVLAMNELSPWPYVVYGVIALVSVMIALQPNREKKKAQQKRIIPIW
ncbi:MAG TPA: glycerol-3-phosphate acyltransferase, partial [Caldilineaceae bacterium]|nr:glycerol-3-phosphate acyltransferase [Caldilineaceae bacterium]